MLPGCGSAWKQPSSSTIFSTMRAPVRASCTRSRPAASTPARSRPGMPSTKSCTLRLSHVHCQCTLGIRMSSRPWKLRAMRSALRHSAAKSSSRRSDTWNCCTTSAGRYRCRSGRRASTISASRASRRRSASITSRMPGRRIFSTTAVPSCSVARCACASEAAAMGVSSSHANTSVAGAPRSRSSCSRTCAYGSAGTAFCSSENSAIQSGGNRSTRVASTWPSLTKVGPRSSIARRTRTGAVIRSICWVSFQCSRRPARSSTSARPMRRTRSPKP
ncbi:hypothetical protein D3C71_1309590 [compost metagenome]